MLARLAAVFATLALACGSNRPVASTDATDDLTRGEDADGASADASVERAAGLDADAGVPDDTHPDGPTAADEPGYAAWWYPGCENADGTCNEETCFRSGVVVSDSVCGPFTALEVGCVPKMMVISGFYCEQIVSDGRIVYSQVFPPTVQFKECPPGTRGNLPPDVNVDLCPDGGPE
jgi:hypothetical protein